MPLAAQSDWPRPSADRFPARYTVSPEASVFTGTVTFTVSCTDPLPAAAAAIAFTSMPTAPAAGTVTVAWPAAFTATVVPAHAPAEAVRLMTLESVPAGSPVLNVSVTGELSALMATHALEPPLNAMALLPSVHQVATAAGPAALCQPTMPAIASQRCSHSQLPVPQAGVAMALPPALGGPRSEEHTSELQSPCNLV